MAAVEIIAFIGLVVACLLGVPAYLDRRSAAEMAAHRALRDNTARAIEDALAFHHMPRRLRRHLERRRLELIAEEITRK